MYDIAGNACVIASIEGSLHTHHTFCIPKGGSLTIAFQKSDGAVLTLQFSGSRLQTTWPSTVTLELLREWFGVLPEQLGLKSPSDSDG